MSKHCQRHNGPRHCFQWHLNWLHYFQIWSPDGATCISSTCIATLLWIALLTLSVSIELVSSSARVTSVKFHKTSLSHSLVSDNQTHRSDQVYLGPIKMYIWVVLPRTGKMSNIWHFFFFWSFTVAQRFDFFEVSSIVLKRF